jgi:hypothetical protein
MGTSQFILDVAELLATAAVAFGVAWYWNWRNDKLARYRYLDEAYGDLLKAYQENPRFGDPLRTSRYRETYGEDALRYHYFAMAVHSLMETVWDFHEGKIGDEWIWIFRHHTALHRAWLRDNQDANRKAYVDQVLAAASATGG